MREITVPVEITCGITVPVVYHGDLTFRRTGTGKYDWTLTAADVTHAVIWTDPKQGQSAYMLATITIQRWTEILANADVITLTDRSRPEDAAGLADLDEMLDRRWDALQEHDPGDDADRYLDRLKTVGSFG